MVVGGVVLVLAVGVVAFLLGRRTGEERAAVALVATPLDAAVVTLTRREPLPATVVAAPAPVVEEMPVAIGSPEPASPEVEEVELPQGEVAAGPNQVQAGSSRQQDAVQPALVAGLLPRTSNRAPHPAERAGSTASPFPEPPSLLETIEPIAVHPGWLLPRTEADPTPARVFDTGIDSVLSFEPVETGIPGIMDAAFAIPPAGRKERESRAIADNAEPSLYIVGHRDPSTWLGLRGERGFLDYLDWFETDDWAQDACEGLIHDHEPEDMRLQTWLDASRGWWLDHGNVGWDSTQ